MSLFYSVTSGTISFTSRRCCLILIVTVLSMTLVASYVLVSPHFYHPSPYVGSPTTIDLHAAIVPDEVSAVEVLIVVDTVLKMKEETSLASTTDGVNTDIFKTNTTGRTVLAHDV